MRERDTRDNKQSRVLLRVNLDLFRSYASTTKINYSCKLLLLQRASHCGRQKETHREVGVERREMEVYGNERKDGGLVGHDVKGLCNGCTS